MKIVPDKENKKIHLPARLNGVIGMFLLLFFQMLHYSHRFDFRKAHSTLYTTYLDPDPEFSDRTHTVRVTRHIVTYHHFNIYTIHSYISSFFPSSSSSSPSFSTSFSSSFSFCIFLRPYRFSQNIPLHMNHIAEPKKKPTNTL